MTRQWMLLSVITLAVSFASVAKEDRTTGQADREKPPTDAKERLDSRESTRDLPVYQPPLRGAPITRVGGGTRGTSQDYPELTVLAPEHTGLTSERQPTLYWRVSTDIRHPVEIAVIDDRHIDPLAVETLAGAKAGIHSFDLSSLEVRLEPDVVYRWSVSVILNPSERSRDIFSSGTIHWSPAPQGLPERLQQADPSGRVIELSKAGLWYDAFAATADIRDQETRRAYRAALVSQVGLALPPEALR